MSLFGVKGDGERLAINTSVSVQSVIGSLYTYIRSLHPPHLYHPISTRYPYLSLNSHIRSIPVLTPVQRCPVMFCSVQPVQHCSIVGPAQFGYVLPGTTGPSLHCRSFIAIQSRPCAAVLSALSAMSHFSFIFPFIRLPLYGMKKAPSRFDLTLCFLFAILVVRLVCVGWTKCRKRVG